MVNIDGTGYRIGEAITDGWLFQELMFENRHRPPLCRHLFSAKKQRIGLTGCPDCGRYSTIVRWRFDPFSDPRIGSGVASIRRQVIQKSALLAILVRCRNPVWLPNTRTSVLPNRHFMANDDGAPLCGRLPIMIFPIRPQGRSPGAPRAIPIEFAPRLLF
jgi:hypothetical protein